MDIEFPSRTFGGVEGILDYFDFLVSIVYMSNEPKSMDINPDFVGEIAPSSRRAGNIQRTFLDVKSTGGVNPIQKIVFDGASNVKRGDYVRLLIPHLIFSDSHIYGEKNNQLCYKPRELKSAEGAIEILTLGGIDIISRIERAVGYGKLIKEIDSAVRWDGKTKFV